MPKTFKQKLKASLAYIYHYYMYNVKNIAEIAFIFVFAGVLLLLVYQGLAFDDHFIVRHWDGKNLENFTVFGYTLNESDFHQRVCILNMTLDINHLNNKITVYNGSDC